MEVKTNYNIGDEVFFINDRSQQKQGVIITVHISVDRLQREDKYEYNQFTSYTIRSNSESTHDTTRRAEELIFTKEEDLRNFVYGEEVTFGKWIEFVESGKIDFSNIISDDNS